MLSIVIPVYNEENNIRPLYECLAFVLDAMEHEYAILFIDDGSTDRSHERLKDLAEKQRKVKNMY